MKGFENTKAILEQVLGEENNFTLSNKKLFSNMIYDWQNKLEQHDLSLFYEGERKKMKLFFEEILVRFGFLILGGKQQ